LKAEETGKKTSTLEMTPTGVWGEVDPKKATVQRGRENTLNLVNASVKFIDKWNELAPKN
jgi:creatinine amidohydrolase